MPRDSGRPLRVALIGASSRASYMYGPLLRALPEVELVAVWGRREAPARELAARLGEVPAYTDLDRLVRGTSPEVGVVAVGYAANGEVGLATLQAGMHALVETPIAHNLAEADAMIASAAARGLKLEVAEQFHRRPQEALKLELLGTGLFGHVHTSFNDFAGHGYHGVSVMRSYLGFDAAPSEVTGFVRRFPVAGGEETQEHGLVAFEDGRLGVYHWTDVAYGSPLRWWRSSRFLAERGMGVAVGVGLDVEERLTLLSPDGEAPRPITVERRLERVDGGALVALDAHTGDPDVPVVRWENPVAPRIQGHGPQWHDDEIGVAGCILSLVRAVREGTEPTYGPHQARLDQELTLAIRRSSDDGGRPVRLPLDPTSQVE